MIRAAIVGSGVVGENARRGGAADSPDIHFVAGTTRTIDGGRRRRSPARRDSSSRRVTRRCWPIRWSMRSCWRRRIRCTRRRSSPPPRPKKHIFCEKPFALTAADAEAAVNATTQAGVTLGLGYNRRFHPEMTHAARPHPLGRARDDPARRSDDDVSQCAGAEADGVAREPRGNAVRRADADGRSRRGRDDRSVRPDRSRLLPELPARRRRSMRTTRRRSCSG